MSAGSAIERRNVVDVPEEVLELLAHLEGKGPALRAGAPSTVGVPSDHNLAMAMGVAADIMARRR